MSRSSQVSDASYQRLLDRAKNLGYDVEKVKRVPQQWPGD